MKTLNKITVLGVVCLGPLLGSANLSAVPSNAMPFVPPDPADKHWTVSVCSSSSDHVTLQAGPSRDDNDVFATWHPADGNGKEYVMPNKVQPLQKIFFQGSISPHHQTELCVKRDGDPKKHMSFDGDNEWHNIDAGDHDDGCPC